jgi:hypothetical protein
MVVIKTKVLSFDIPEECKALIKTIDKQFTCSTINDLMRIRTPYSYPDGDVIDLYLKKQENSYILTDLGEAFRALSLYSGLFITSDQTKFIDYTLSQFNITKFNGILTIEFCNKEEIAEAVLNLAQAIFKITKKYYDRGYSIR